MNYILLIRAFVTLGLCFYALAQALMFFNPSGVPGGDLGLAMMAMLIAFLIAPRVEEQPNKKADKYSFAKSRLQGPFL